MSAKTMGLLAVVLGAIASLGVGLAAAQNSGTEVRIEARRLADGRIEFALRERGGERILPPARYFPTSSEGRWLNSSWINVGDEPVAMPGRSSSVPPHWTWFDGENVNGKLWGYWTKASPGSGSAFEWASLSVRCAPYGVDVFIALFGYRGGDQHEVSWRFSSQRYPTRETWNSEWNDNLFLWGSSAFLKTLSRIGGTLFVAIGQTSMEFDVDGSSDVFASLSCQTGAGA